jgi:hypothetical protein
MQRRTSAFGLLVLCGLLAGYLASFLWFQRAHSVVISRADYERRFPNEPLGGPPLPEEPERHWIIPGTRLNRALFTIYRPLLKPADRYYVCWETR